jgi:hypothetical protein
VSPEYTRSHVLALMAREPAPAQDTKLWHLTVRLEELRAEVADLETLAGDLATGIAPWQWWDPEYTCSNRQETATEEAALALADARDRLRAAERELDAELAPGGDAA